MINDVKNMQGFYHDQNIQIRKQIRQMDMQYKELIYNSKNSNSQKQQQLLKQDINFLVIGPSKSGKSSLLKTMYFALNSNFNPQITTNELPGTVIKKIDIKRNKKYQVEGLTKMKQTDPKKTISGFEFQDKSYFRNYDKELSSEQKSSKVFQKYSSALQLIDNRVFGCFKVSSYGNNTLFQNEPNNQQSSSFLSIRTVLIVLNILSKTQFEEISCMKFFLSDIKEKGIKTLIILTHVDKLNHYKENDKLTLIEQKISMLKKQLDIKDRDDFICVQNYHEHNENSIDKKSAQLNKYLSPQNRHSNEFQNFNHSNKLFSQQPSKFGHQGVFQYKKVSQSYINDESLQMQIPLINIKQRKQFQMNYQPNKQYIQQQPMTVSWSISCNSSEDNRYAKVSAKNINSLSNIPPIIQEKLITKKSSQINCQTISQNMNRDQINSHNQIVRMTNSQQINYYSLKLLVKVLKQSQKYVNRELKQRKMIKWFCG